MSTSIIIAIIAGVAAIAGPFVSYRIFQRQYAAEKQTVEEQLAASRIAQVNAEAARIDAQGQQVFTNLSVLYTNVLTENVGLRTRLTTMESQMRQMQVDLEECRKSHAAPAAMVTTETRVTTTEPKPAA